MEEKPSMILQPEVIQEKTETPFTEPESVEPKQDMWNKFPPQVDRSSANKPSRGLMWFVIILIAIAVAVVGLAIRQFMASGTDNVRTIVSPDSTPTPTTEIPTPTPSPTPEITDKSEVTIQVLNASGITGRAGRVASALESIDFEDVDTGNADEDDQVETVIEYSPKVDKKLIDEIIAEVEDMFTNVRSIVNESLEDYHVLITTGTDEASE